MKTKKSIILIMGLMQLSLISLGQPAINTSSYHTAIGLRGGATSGLTIKHFMGSGSALEGIVGIWPNGISITGLYEKHANAGLEGLNWYYGGGGHVGFESGRYYNKDYYYYRNHYRDGGAAIGIDGIIGIEYKINPIPFAISLDLKPFFEVNTGGGNYFSLDPGLGIKFTF
jgi:hypothetical protein